MEDSNIQKVIFVARDGTEVVEYLTNASDFDIRLRASALNWYVKSVESYKGCSNA